MAKYADTAAAIADGMLHYWPMNEASGVDIEDLLKQDFDASFVCNDDAADNSIVDALFSRGRHMRQGGPGNLGPQIGLKNPVPGGGVNRQEWAWSIWFTAEQEPGLYDALVNWQLDGAFDGSWGLRITSNATNFNVIHGQTLANPNSTITVGDHNIIVSRRNVSGAIYTMDVFLDGALLGTFGSGGPLKLEQASSCQIGHGLSGGNPKLGWPGVMADFGIWGRSILGPEAAEIWASGVGLPILAPPAPPAPPAVPEPLSSDVRFECTVAGANDGKADALVALSSLVVRQSATARYAQVTMPATAENEAAIADRPNGDISVAIKYKGASGSEFTAAVVSFAPTSTTTDRGGTSRSITLTGTFALVTAAESRQAAGVSYINDRGAQIRARCTFDPSLAIGDTFEVEPGLSITVASTALFVSGNRIQFEVSG